MNAAVYDKLRRMETTPEAMGDTVSYIAGRLRSFVRNNEQVLLCYPDRGESSYGAILAGAVRACGAQPVFWERDHRWKTLLRQAFSLRIRTVVGMPLVILGLMKMAKATATPLYIRNVLLGGHPCDGWMAEGIRRGLDCRIWGCYSLGPGPVVAGFTCDRCAGTHLREELFGAEILDEEGKGLPEPQCGRLVLRYRRDPELILDTAERARLIRQPCACGSDAPRIRETGLAGQNEPLWKTLEDRFLVWSSILDYRMEQTESGLALELVVFPGESLPVIPSCAKLRIRPWDPEKDVPFCMQELDKLAEKDWQNC